MRSSTILLLACALAISAYAENDLRSEYEALDTDHDGVLTRDEFVAGMAAQNGEVIRTTINVSMTTSPHGRPRAFNDTTASPLAMLTRVSVSRLQIEDSWDESNNAFVETFMGEGEAKNGYTSVYLSTH